MTPTDDTNQAYVAETPQYAPKSYPENKPDSSNKTPLVIGIIVLILGLLYVAIIRPMLKSGESTTKKSVDPKSATLKKNTDETPKEEVDDDTGKKEEPAQDPSENTGGGAPRR